MNSSQQLPSPTGAALSTTDLSHAIEVAGRLAKDAAAAIANNAGRQAAPGTKANPFDWVTDTDRSLERHTRSVLAAEFPEIPVLGEEFGTTAGAATALPGTPGGPDLLWIVDPVDGTSNYVAGLPWSCYSLALVDAAGPLVGVIADPYSGEIHSAARGRGLHTNGNPVVASPIDTLAGSLILAEPSQPGRRPDTGKLLATCRAAHIGPRVIGSSALAITQVVLGRAAAAVLPERGYQVWDVAGALALALEAGLRVTDLAGSVQPLPLNGLVVSVPAVADEFAALLAAS